MTQKPKTIDLHILLEAELEGTTIKSIQTERVIPFPLPGFEDAMLFYLNTNYIGSLMELLQHPTDNQNIYYHQISLHDALKRGYSIPIFGKSPFRMG